MGWIEWKGGECPVPDEEIVHVQFRTETRDEAAKAGCEEAGVFPWDHCGADEDIIAYRVVAEERV